GDDERIAAGGWNIPFADVGVAWPLSSRFLAKQAGYCECIVSRRTRVFRKSPPCPSLALRTRVDWIRAKARWEGMQGQTGRSPDCRDKKPGYLPSVPRYSFDSPVRASREPASLRMTG